MIYFLQSVDGNCPIKIGTTSSLSIRVKQLTVEHGTTLRVLAVCDGSYEVENELHCRFGHLRTSREWFKPGPDLLDFIATECRTWDGVDEVSPNVPVKIDAEVLKMIRLIAKFRGITTAQYLSEVIRPIAERDLKHEVASFEISPKKSPERKGRKGGDAG